MKKYSDFSDIEKQILCSALYISINFTKFRNFVKNNRPNLYKKIYSPYEDDEKISKEKLHEMMGEFDLELIDEIREAEIELSKTEKKGNIGTIETHIRWMIINYNAMNQNGPEIEEFDSWRPPKKIS